MRSIITNILIAALLISIVPAIASANSNSYFQKIVDRTERVYPEGILFSKREMALQDTPDRSHQIKFHMFSTPGDSVFKSWLISIEKAKKSDKS